MASALGTPHSRRSISVDVAGLRSAGAVMLGAAALLPFLPAHPGLVCPLRTLTGIPCPLCGMSTSVEATLRGHLGHAASANPAGIGAVAVALWLLLRPPRRLSIPITAVALGAACMWLFELGRFGFLAL